MSRFLPIDIETRVNDTRDALKTANGNIIAAAKLLGLQPEGMRNRVRKYRLEMMVVRGNRGRVFTEAGGRT